MSSYYNKKYFQERDHLDLHIAYAIKILMQKHKLKKVLDVGCGSGRLVEFLLKNGFDAYGCDISTAAINFARNIDKKRFIKASASNLPYDKNSFDMIVCISLIEHLTSKEANAFLSRSYAMLKKNGIIFLVTPNFLTPFRIIQGKKWFGYSDPTHITFYSQFSLAKLLLRNKFKKINFFFKMDYSVKFNWDLPDIVRKFPPFVGNSILYLVTETPFTIIRNSFWISGIKK